MSFRFEQSGVADSAIEGEKETLREIKGEFLRVLEERFGEGGRKLDFHKAEHSLNVAEKAVKFLETIRNIDPSLVSESDIILAQIEALGHDLVQNGKIEKGKLVRDRGVGRGGNEGDSAAEVLERIGKYTLADGSRVFPADDEEFARKVFDDIAATFSDFSFAELPSGKNALKVFQPYLTEKSSLRALAIANADLRGEASSDPRNGDFPRSGNAEFRELNPGIAKELRSGIENIPQARRGEIAEQILNWQNVQPGFAEWQKILFMESLENNKALNSSVKSGEIRKALLKLFPLVNFDKNIAEAEDKHRKLARRLGVLNVTDDAKKKEILGRIKLEDFKYVLRSAGYEVKFTVLKNAA